MEPDEKSTPGQLEPNWQPAPISRSVGQSKTFPWLASGIALLIASWIALSIVAFIEQQFRVSASIGVVTLICFSVAMLLIFFGLAREIRSLAALERVSQLREGLRRDDLSMAEARALCRPWLTAVQVRFPQAREAQFKIETATSMSDIRKVLRSTVIAPMKEAASYAGGNAAMQGAILIAATPSPLIEAAIVTIRSVMLLRQVARIYGLRPGLLVTVTLLRHIAQTAAVVAGTDIAVQSLVGVFSKLPFVGLLADSVPGITVAAYRFHRLAALTAETCTPLPTREI